MGPKYDKKKRKTSSQRQKKKNNETPMMSRISGSQVEENSCQNSIVTGHVAEKSNGSLGEINNTAQTSIVAKTVVDKPKIGFDGNVVEKPNSSFEGINNTAENLIVTGNITKKSNSGLKGIKSTGQNIIKTKNVTEEPSNGFKKIKNTAQNLIVPGNVTEKPNEGVKGTGIYSCRLDIFKKVSNLLSVDNKWLITALEKLVLLHDDVSAEKRLRLQTMDLLLSHLKTSDSEELEALLNICKNLFIHQALAKYIVNGKTLRSEGILLGRGGFGTVNLGRLYKPDGSWTKVAIKEPILVKNNKACIEEAKLMTQFDHKNVVKILAFQKSPPKIAMEYLEWGNLTDALREHHFMEIDLIKALHDVALGMEYIASLNYVHRDLACKNIFVNSKKQCKVGDFGLCKYVGDANGFYEEKKYFLATYNTAPESKETQRFSLKSDVWSMGVLMWEIYFTYSNTDSFEFPILEFFFRCNLLENTGMLQKPIRCPLSIHAYIISEVLLRNPRRRTTFTAIKKFLSKHLPVQQ